jgi:PAS domain S-box-containing protein
MAEPERPSSDQGDAGLQVASPASRLPAILLILLVLILTAGAIHFNRGTVRDTEVARLQAITTAKSQLITIWLRERMDEAHLIQGNSALASAYYRWRDDGDLTSRDWLRKRMNEFIALRQFTGVVLLDDQARPLWSTGSAGFDLDPAHRAEILRAARDSPVSRLNAEIDTSGSPHLHFVIALRDKKGRAGGLLLFHTDSGKYLPAKLLDWPIPSHSGETLLFKRVGTQVMYLNATRFQPDPKVRLRLALSTPGLIAAQVINGTKKLDRLIEGVDYRGEPVIGVAHAIQDSDWFVLSKLDRAEFDSAAKASTSRILLAGALIMLSGLAVQYIVRQRRQLGVARNLALAQSERLRALRLLTAIADGSSEAIFAKDRDGRYILFNRQAESYFGKRSDEVLGNDDTLLLSPEEVAMLRTIDQEVMHQDQPVTYQYALALPRGVRTLSVSKGPLRDVSGAVVGIFGIARDITDFKQAETTLTATAEFVSRAGGEALFPTLVRHAAGNLGLDFVRIALLDASGLSLRTLAAWLDDELIPNWTYGLIGTPCAEVIQGNRSCIAMDVQALYPDDLDLRRIGARSYVGEPMFDASGKVIGLLAGGSRLALNNSERIQDNLRILAARVVAELQQRQATQALRESEERYRLAFRTSPDAINLNRLSDGCYLDVNIGF